MVINGNKTRQKLATKFYCEKCLYSCSKESDYKKHLITRKHINGNIMVTQNSPQKKVADVTILHDNNIIHNSNVTNIITKKSPNTSLCNNYPHACQVCGQCYKYASGLSRHRKKCNKQSQNIESNIITTNLLETSKESQNEFKELVVMLLKENKEIQKNFIEMIPHIKGNAENSFNTTNTNSHNTNNFNVQMFLNEKCKNAMNLTDFIQSLPITNETYDHTIENGLTKTITHMITSGLNNMDILERPIHCTDPARKTMYIKDNDVWEKDNELKNLLDGIKSLSIKQRVNICKWYDANEGWETKSNLQTRLSSLVFHTMEDIENNEKEVSKIIRAISKNTYLSNDIKEEYK